MGLICPGNRKALDSENNDLYEAYDYKFKF